MLFSTLVVVYRHIQEREFSFKSQGKRANFSGSDLHIYYAHIKISILNRYQVQIHRKTDTSYKEHNYANDTQMD